MLEDGREKWNSRSSGKMRRSREEHRWRRQLLGPYLTLSARKRGEQTGLDTLVVHAVNDDH